MLNGKPLGQAIQKAIALKGVSKRAVAADFGVKPPSITDWVNKGTISKDKLPKLWAYFSDVVGPEHWGLDSYPTKIPTEALQVNEPASEYHSIPKIDSLFSDLAELWRSLPDHGRHELIGMAKLLTTQAPKNSKKGRRS